MLKNRPAGVAENVVDGEVALDERFAVDFVRLDVPVEGEDVAGTERRDAEEHEQVREVTVDVAVGEPPVPDGEHEHRQRADEQLSPRNSNGGDTGSECQSQRLQAD